MPQRLPTALLAGALLILVMGTPVLAAPAGADAMAARCLEKKQRAKLLRSKLRAGYSRAQGERWEAELRRIREFRRRFCRRR